MKTRLLLVLLALLTVLSLVACNSSKTEDPADTTGKEEITTGGNPIPDGEETTGKPSTEDPLAHLPTDTYNDEEFSILINQDAVRHPIILENIGAQSTSVERAVYERLTNISTTYKIKFQGYKLPYAQYEFKNAMSNYSKTGVDAMDLCMTHGQHAAFPLAIQGCLYEWNQMSLIDLDASYWSQDAREQFSTPGGKLFFQSGDANYLTVGTAFCMFFNKDMIENINGLEQPFDLVREGEWTLEMLETYVASVASSLNSGSTGELGKDPFAYVVIHNRGPVAVLSCTNYRMLTRDENEEFGYKQTGRKTDVVRAVADYVDLVLRSGNTYYYRITTQTDTYNVHNAFIGETVGFFEDEVDYAGTIAKSNVSFGVLPWPKYDEDCDNYTSLVDAGLDMFCVLVNTSDANLQRISVVLENLAYYGQRDVMPLYYETVLSYQYLKDEDSLEMLHYIHDSLIYDFAFFYNPAGMSGAATIILNGGGNQSLTSWLDSNSGTINDALKQWITLDD